MHKFKRPPLREGPNMQINKIRDQWEFKTLTNLELQYFQLLHRIIL